MNPEYLKSLDQFLKSNLRNTYLKFDNINVYIRKSQRISPINNNTLIEYLDIANIKVDQNMRRRGICTQFMSAAEALNIPIFVENILNKEFQEFLLKRGYKQHSGYNNDICLFHM